MKQKHEIADALAKVQIAPGFWGDVIERTRTVTLPHVIAECESHGLVRNLDIAARSLRKREANGSTDTGYSGGSSVDSNVFKTMEGAAYFRGFESWIDQVAAKIAAAQEPDGYLNSYFTSQAPDRKYTDLHRSHELYVAGHFIEAAVAHLEATGKRELLTVAIRLADHIEQTFGPGKLETVPGHQELELALVRLADATGCGRYLELARYFVVMRGDPARVARDYAGKPVIESETHPGRNRPPAYRQDHLPALQQREATGHAVRAGYFYAALADIALAYGDDEFAHAADAIWNTIVEKKIYLTGGVGTHQYRDEGFGDDYLLPNETGYCETCGGVALLLFTHRMNLLHGDSRYADLMELILFNHFLGSTSLDGRDTFYQNPLATDGSRRRAPWHDPACCPTNVVRVVPQISKMIYAVGDNTIYVDQFAAGTATLRVAVGHELQTVELQTIRLGQRTSYPWDGRIELEIHPEASVELSLCIRIPGWVRGRPVPSELYNAESDGSRTLSVAVRPANSEVDAEARPGEEANGYYTITRTWSAGDTVVVDLPMDVRRVYADSRIAADRGRVALMRGPVVYCVEAADLVAATNTNRSGESAGGPGADPREMVLPRDLELTAEHRADMLGGVTIIRPKGDQSSESRFIAVPYYARDNREPGPMAVWLKEA